MDSIESIKFYMQSLKSDGKSDFVLLFRAGVDDHYKPVKLVLFEFSSDQRYAVCHKKHLNPVLGVLNNNRAVNVKSDRWEWVPARCEDEKWYLNPDIESRLVPRVRNRWIAVNHGGVLVDKLYISEEDALNNNPDCESVEEVELTF